MTRWSSFDHAIEIAQQLRRCFLRAIRECKKGHLISMRRRQMPMAEPSSRPLATSGKRARSPALRRRSGEDAFSQRGSFERRSQGHREWDVWRCCREHVTSLTKMRSKLRLRDAARHRRRRAAHEWRGVEGRAAAERTQRGTSGQCPAPDSPPTRVGAVGFLRVSRSETARLPGASPEVELGACAVARTATRGRRRTCRR